MSFAEPMPVAAPTDAYGIPQLTVLGRRGAQTSLHASAVAARISQVIEEWEASLTGRLLVGSYAHGTSVAPADQLIATLVLVHDATVDTDVEVIGHANDYPADPVDAVRFLVETAQVSQDEVLRACRIAERTFFGWKTNGRRPRPASIGTLWALVEAVYYLRSAHPSLAGWLHSNREAREAFASGDVDRLVGLELSEVMRGEPLGSRDVPDFGDAGDWEPAASPRRRHRFTNVTPNALPRR